MCIRDSLCVALAKLTERSAYLCLPSAGIKGMHHPHPATMATHINKNISLGLAYSFRGLVHYRHGSMQADMVLEKELRVPHVDLQAANETVCHTSHSLSRGDLKAHPPQ